MKVKYLFTLLCCTSSWVANAQTPESEKEAVKTVCNYYLDGGTNGDSVLFSKAFSPDGLMQYMRNDTVRIVSLNPDFAVALSSKTQWQICIFNKREKAIIPLPSF